MGDPIKPGASAAPAPRSKVVAKTMAWILFAIVFVSASPLLCALIAGVIANTLGCQLDEGNVHPCLIAGVDLGEILYAMGVLGWLTLATMPMGALALVGWLVALAVIATRSIWRRRRDRAGP
jgi:hypothetical protein